MTTRQTLAAAAAFAFVLHLSGCDRPGPDVGPTAADEHSASAPPNSGGHPSDVPAVPAPLIAASGTAAANSHPPVSPTAQPPARQLFAVQPAPDHVLRDWGAAIERRDWAAVRALWGNRGADSGLSAKEFAARWDRLRRPRVTVGSGDQEGAAGSLFYTAPVTVTDGLRTIAGAVTLRRVNDVDGATPEQLRWHFDPGTQAPWTAP